MNEPIHQDELNRILLKPRFKLKYSDPKEAIIDQFRVDLSSESCPFPSKIVDHHIVIDVPQGREHFWSPQLHVEVEDEGGGFDPTESPRNSATRVHGCTSKRGWGLTLIRELMDEVQIRSNPGMTLVRMRKYVENAP